MLGEIGKSSGVPIKHSTIVDATESMYNHRVLKVGRREREALLDSAGRDTVIGTLEIVRATEDLKNQPKFRNVGGSGESNDGQRAMDAARQLFWMGAGSVSHNAGCVQDPDL